MPWWRLPADRRMPRDHLHPYTKEWRLPDRTCEQRWRWFSGNPPERSIYMRREIDNKRMRYFAGFFLFFSFCSRAVKQLSYHFPTPWHWNSSNSPVPERHDIRGARSLFLECVTARLGRPRIFCCCGLLWLHNGHVVLFGERGEAHSIRPATK